VGDHCQHSPVHLRLGQEVELREDVAAVRLDRLLREEQRLCGDLVDLLLVSGGVVLLPGMARLDPLPASNVRVGLELRAADPDPQDVPEAHDAQHRRSVDDRQMPEALAHHGLGGIIGVHVGAGRDRVAGHPLRDRR
jgi:hypothetical protein